MQRRLAATVDASRAEQHAGFARLRWVGLVIVSAVSIAGVLLASVGSSQRLSSQQIVQTHAKVSEVGSQVSLVGDRIGKLEQLLQAQLNPSLQTNGNQPTLGMGGRTLDFPRALRDWAAHYKLTPEAAQKELTAWVEETRRRSNDLTERARAEFLAQHFVDAARLSDQAAAEKLARREHLTQEHVRLTAEAAFDLSRAGRSLIEAKRPLEACDRLRQADKLLSHKAHSDLSIHILDDLTKALELAGGEAKGGERREFDLEAISTLERIADAHTYRADHPTDWETSFSLPADPEPVPLPGDLTVEDVFGPDDPVELEARTKRMVALIESDALHSVETEVAFLQKLEEQRSQLLFYCALNARIHVEHYTDHAMRRSEDASDHLLFWEKCKIAIAKAQAMIDTECQVCNEASLKVFHHSVAGFAYLRATRYSEDSLERSALFDASLGHLRAGLDVPLGDSYTGHEKSILRSALSEGIGYSVRGLALESTRTGRKRELLSEAIVAFQTAISMRDDTEDAQRYLVLAQNELAEASK